ncbi:MAG: hypothetical protein J6I66_09065 [Lachnospiraceae bacterium]|nr:hypothetical protein [Lachnospiraceae bacterium]
MNTENSTYNNYNPDRGRNAFDTASLVMGIISLVLLCTGVLSIPSGALGILFNILGKKPGAQRSGTSKAGLALSVVGMAMGVITVSVAFYWFCTDPSAPEQIRRMYEVYGMEMPDFPIFSGG